MVSGGAEPSRAERDFTIPGPSPAVGRNISIFYSVQVQGLGPKPRFRRGGAADRRGPCPVKREGPCFTSEAVPKFPTRVGKVASRAGKPASRRQGSVRPPLRMLGVGSEVQRAGSPPPNRFRIVLRIVMDCWHALSRRFWEPVVVKSRERSSSSS